MKFRLTNVFFKQYNKKIEINWNIMELDIKSLERK